MPTLSIEKRQYTPGWDTMRVSGFTDAELAELKRMPHEESGEKLLELLDSRCDGIGTCWTCGYGVRGHWFDNEAAYVNIGTNCD